MLNIWCGHRVKCRVAGPGRESRPVERGHRLVTGVTVSQHRLLWSAPAKSFRHQTHKIMIKLSLQFHGTKVVSIQYHSMHIGQIPNIALQY